jgi:hypothetical protein
MPHAQRGKLAGMFARLAWLDGGHVDEQRALGHGIGNPSSNSTSPTMAPLSSRLTAKSTPRTASAALSWMLTPSAASGSALARVRFQTWTSWPAWARRRAMGRPIMPVPRTAIFNVFMALFPWSFYE